MRNLFRSLQQWLADVRPMHRLGEALFRMKLRRRAAELDRLNVGQCQKRILLRLIHKARKTRFGLAHDFQRIKTAADYRRLVPLRSADFFWRDYWRPVWPDVAGATWPERVTGMTALHSARGEGPIYLPMTPGIAAAQRIALDTALALAFNYCPESLDHFHLDGCGLSHVGTGVAVEDPRHQRLRLIPDGGIYFELVPAEELDKPAPTRHELAEAEPGAAYALAVTSPAGLWACLTEARLCVERRDLLLIRLLEKPLAAPKPTPALGVTLASPSHLFPSQPPHERPFSGGRTPRPESWKHARRLARRLLSDV